MSKPAFTPPARRATDGVFARQTMNYFGKWRYRVPNAGIKALRRARELGELVSPAKMMGAAARTGGVATHSMSFSGRPVRAYPEVPISRPTMPRLMSIFAEEAMLGAAAGVVGRLTSDQDEMRRIARDVDNAVDLFDSKGWLDNPAAYHREPSPPDDFVMEPRESMRIKYMRMTFDSGYEPATGLPGAERWLALQPNRQCQAFVMEHRGGPRPWIVFLHGHGMGLPMDLFVWGALRYYRDLGFNVLAPVLPLHGTRASSGGRFVSLDWVSNVHALTQAVWDVRRCLAWIREREPSSIAMHGMSLGGYTTALLAGLDAELSCVIAGVPASTIHRPLIAATSRDAALQETLQSYGLIGERTEALHRVVTPTALPCLVPQGRRYIYAGTIDRITTPIEPYQLWQHWGKPAIYWSPTSHTFTMLSSKVRAFVREAIIESAESAVTA